MSRKRLAQLQSLYTENHAGMTRVLDKAADENRSALTPEEETQVSTFRAELERIGPELETLVSAESRSRQMADLVAEVDEGTGNDDGSTGTGEVRGAAPGGPARFTTQDRDPGHYRSAKEGGAHSFFHDMVYARADVADDVDARTRLNEHQRALSTGVAGAGIVPPKWLTEEFAPIARQERGIANAVRHIDLGDDPRPMTLPGQTAGTDAAIAEQATENTHPSETDGYATGTVTVTPKPTSGIQVVSRQMIDMTTPAVDELIYADMLAVYDEKIEAAVSTALVTAAGTAVTTFATEAAFVTGTAALDAMVDLEFAVWAARKLPADLTVMRIPRWGKFRKLRDTTGRSLIPPEFARQQMVNVNGVGTVAARGQIEDLAVIPTAGLGTTAYPESILGMRARDTILFEGAVQRFRFEEVAGPESVKLGIWAYTAVTVRYASSVKRIVVTAA
jgi:HK97 family phage major capsid protein